MMKVSKEDLLQCFALAPLINFFNNDCHHIVSKQGWEILNEKHNHSK